MDVKAGFVLIVMLSNISGLHAADSYLTSRQHKDDVLKYLRSTLRATGYAGRLYYSGDCGVGDAEFVTFPQINMRRPESTSAFGGVQEMFRGDEKILVTEQPNKIITVRIGEPSTAVLGTKISQLKLTAIAQYNPNLVIGAFENSREMKAEMAKLGLHVPLVLSDELLAQPSKRLKHLPAIMNNMTVEQIFSIIATTFNGVVVYGVCSQPNGEGLLEVDFVGVGNSGHP